MFKTCIYCSCSPLLSCRRGPLARPGCFFVSASQVSRVGRPVSHPVKSQHKKSVQNGRKHCPRNAWMSDRDSECIDTAGGSSSSKLKRAELELKQIDYEVSRLQARRAKLLEERDTLLKQIQQDLLAPRRDWHDKFEWDDELQKLLNDVFHLQAFRPLQQQVINATIQGRDVLCLLPSGGGKSLCYQLPALMANAGLTLVVSPLLSLIQDQVLGLSALGVSAAALTSLTPKEEATATLRDMGGAGTADLGPPRLVYVTPEKIVASKRLMAKLEKLNLAGRLSRIVIDEAHCCSAWGNDFRPDYKKLGVLKQQFPQVPIIALTATATYTVCEDIKSILRIQGAELFQQSINRPNLYYEVRHRKSTDLPGLAQEVAAWISEHYKGRDSGIVYCLTRKDCEQLSQELCCANISARFYHADMEPGPREKAHQDWSAGRVQVMVATIAFGMGINKPDVRFVVHASISKSIENYYQESGRAGRDGMPARCVLFYRFNDVMRQAAIVCMDQTWSANLTSMSRYAAASAGKCRRAIIQAHFAEPTVVCCNGMCDSCSAIRGIERSNIREYVVAVLRALQAIPAIEKRATLIQLVDAWRSSKSADPASAKMARTMSKDECEEVIAHMVLLQLLQLDFGFTAYTTNTYLKATDRGVALLEPQVGGAAGQAIYLERRLPEYSSPGKHPRPPPCKVQLSLLAWRESVASAARIFPHSVLPDLLVERIPLIGPRNEEAVGYVLGDARGKLYAAQVFKVMKEGFVPAGNGTDAGDGGGAPGVGQGHCAEPAARVHASFNAAAGTSEGQPISNQQNKRPSTGGAQAGVPSKESPELIEVLSSDDAGEDFVEDRKKRVKAGRGKGAQKAK